MRVKKFEAKTMKDALAMVKAEMGPEAVILSAKDNRKRQGLTGDQSVEVTAAVSEQTLQKKRFVESRFREVDKAKFVQRTAKQQKAIIDKMVDRRLLSAEEDRPHSKPQTTVSYINIHDEPNGDPVNPNQEARQADSGVLQERALKRIRVAAKDALSAGLSTIEETRPTPVHRSQNAKHMEQIGTRSQAIKVDDREVMALKEEIKRLKGLVENFTKVPQTFVNGHPGSDYAIPFDLSFMFQKLTQAGIGIENTVDLLNSCRAEMNVIQMKRAPLVDAWVAKRLLDFIQTVPHPIQSRFHFFVGGSGSGKTSSLVKMASKLVIEEKRRVAVISTDTFKVGAVDQLKIYCQILNVPLAIVRTSPEWEWVLSQLTKMDHILVDFPGLNLRDLDEISLFKSLLPPENTDASCHMVIPCTAKDCDAMEIARRYKIANINDFIFTNLDQSTQHGMIYNLQRKLGLPLHSFGIGNRIPEDFEFATKERVLDLIFKLTRIRRETN